MSVVLIFLKSNDTADEGGDYTTVLPVDAGEMENHKTMYIAIAIGLVALSVHSWLVIFALYKHDSTPENKIVDDAIAATMSKYPPLQNVSTIDDGIRFTYN